MVWTFTANLDVFPDSADAWLRRDPVRNTVPMTVLRRIRHGLWKDGVLLGWYAADAEVRGVVIHTPPYRLLLGDIPLESVPSLAEELRDRDIAGVTGPLAQAEAFGRVYERAERGRLDQRLYRLETLRSRSSTGTSRPANDGDIELAVQWMTSFLREAEPEAAGSDPLPQIKHRIGEGELVLWQDGGRPVAMAGFSSPIVGMSRIGPVYTPPEHRRRGYGSAVTHATTRAAQDAGADLMLLFTDLANPTSNSIYQALGYRPVADYVSLSFAGPA